jgi:hypothetical protein
MLDTAPYPILDGLAKPYPARSEVWTVIVPAARRLLRILAKYDPMYF